MSYVDENLLPGEQVIYRAELHKIIYTGPATLAVLALLFIVIVSSGEGTSGLAVIGAIVLVAAGIAAAGNYVTASSSEFAVTNRRVLIKVGILHRHTVELLLHKVEGVGVDQGVLGRLFDFGSIIVTGTGGTKEHFANIADPLEFRRQVQGQAGSDTPTGAAASGLNAVFCVSCGTQNPAHAQFCMRCGQRLAKTNAR